MDQKTTLYLPDDMQRELKALAKRTGATQAHIIREALAAFLAREEPPLPRSIGAGNDASVGGAEAKQWARDQWRQKWSR